MCRSEDAFKPIWRTRTVWRCHILTYCDIDEIRTNLPLSASSRQVLGLTTPLPVTFRSLAYQVDGLSIHHCTLNRCRIERAAGKGGEADSRPVPDLVPAHVPALAEQPLAHVRAIGEVPYRIRQCRRRPSAATVPDSKSQRGPGRALHLLSLLLQRILATSFARHDARVARCYSEDRRKRLRPCADDLVLDRPIQGWVFSGRRSRQNTYSRSSDNGTVQV